MSHQRNLDRLAVVARTLRELNDEVVYVGGAVVSLYVPIEQTSHSRPTDDIDVVIELATYSAYSHLLDRLTAKGFIQSPSDDVICRFRLQGFIIDVMTTQDIGMGSPNRWYANGFRTSIRQSIQPDVSIRILSPAYFLATKLEAYFSRGQQEPYASKDMEDIIFLIDHCTNLQESITSAELVLRLYFAEAAQRLSRTRNLTDIILGHINGRHQEERTRRILNFIDQLANP